MMHDFCQVQDPDQRMNEMVNFTKNMALAGAAAALMAVKEPWPASIGAEEPGMVDRVKQAVHVLAA
jgi:hypothetical protein